MIVWLRYHLFGGKDAKGWTKNRGRNPAPGQPVTAVRRDGVVVCRWSNSLDWKRRGEKTDLIKWKYLEDL